MKKLIKSYNFWTCLSGACGILAVTIFKLFGKQIESKTVEELIMAICGVLVIFGVVSKPKSKTEISEVNLTDETMQDNQNEKESAKEQVKIISKQPVKKNSADKQKNQELQDK